MFTLQENENFANLRDKGIGQELYNKYSIIFADSVVMGEYAYAPSSGMLSDDIDMERVANTPVKMQDNNVKDDFNEYLENIMSNGSILGGSSSQTIFGDASQQNIRKQKRTEGSTSYGTRKKSKQLSGVAQLCSTIQELKDAMKESAEKKFYDVQYFGRSS